MACNCKGKCCPIPSSRWPRKTGWDAARVCLWPGLPSHVRAATADQIYSTACVQQCCASTQVSAVVEHEKHQT